MNQFVFSVCCVLLCVTVLSLPAPQNLGAGSAGQDVKVLQYYNQNNGLDGYKFFYELSDGQVRKEEGTFVDGKDAAGGDVKILHVIGAYSFIAPDQQTYWVNFTADENGYHPKVGSGTVGGIQPGRDLFSQ
ncbi:endocuticle structural glycoprotein ABD-5-like [Wyeomyia smithii]|uniref:endocuticle structural glycoprotein ABD-5-like n=1 Tax=Wyeomyia smithii TaxID=174621 RepID=UPI002467AC95|nr:endocuticle structural glycoprotein ABD-5-like [Wyeomyia smithii]